MEISRRGFLAGLAAWFAARRLPKVKPIPIDFIDVTIGQWADYWPPAPIDSPASDPAALIDGWFVGGIGYKQTFEWIPKDEHGSQAEKNPNPQSN